MLRKGLAVAVILLFFSVSVPSSGFGAENHCLINDSIGYFNSIRQSEERGVNVTLNGTMGENGWYISCVYIQISFGPDVQSFYYQFNGGGWQQYTEPFGPICEDGEHTFCWFYVDNEGNQSDVECIDFKIDQTAPTIELTWDEENKMIIADVDDETSGVAKVEFYVNDEFLGEVTEAPWEWHYPEASAGDIAMAIVYDFAGNSAVTDFVSPPVPLPILLIGPIRDFEINNESVNFHANIVIFLLYGIAPLFTIINEDISLENNYRGFVGKRFIFAFFWM